MTDRRRQRPDPRPPGADHADTGRRRFLQRLGAGALLAPAIAYGKLGDRHHYAGDPLFTLGVASGDPTANSVVLWTRLAPEPLNGGGMGRRPVFLDWEIALDPGMARVVRRGRATALARDGHAVRVIARGLPPDSWLYFRFRALGHYSRVGRTRTFPAASGAAGRMRFAVANCQNYQQGFFPAYADMLDQDLDFVLHVGDYIYENAATSLPIADGRVHPATEAFSVDDYRNRYALYRLDPDLQEAHAQLPFIVTWDDHEVDNNYAGKVAEEVAPWQGAEFLERRRNAYQVYAETMPIRPRLRRRALDDLVELRLFRRLDFGTLARLHVLDTRQYRTDQPCEDLYGSLDPSSLVLEPEFGKLFCPDEILDPDTTMLGESQEGWLYRGLKRSDATWNVLAQSVMVTRWDLSPFVNSAFPPLVLDSLFSVDAWDGLRAAQDRLREMLAELRPGNPVIITGDIHSAWGADIPASYESDEGGQVAAEFVSTSIASTLLDLNPVATDTVIRTTLAPGANDDIRYYNGLFRGYCLCDVTPERWTTTYRAVGSLLDLPVAIAAAQVGDNQDTSLVPRADSPVDTDAVLTLDAGFNDPAGGDGLAVQLERIPTRG